MKVSKQELRIFASALRQTFFAVSALVFLVCSCARPNDYDRMVYLLKYKDDLEAAHRLAHQLRNTPEGIKAAISDLSVSGGRSRGLGSWILVTSSLTTNVELQLNVIAGAPLESMNRRVEALWILWQRT